MHLLTVVQTSHVQNEKEHLAHLKKILVSGADIQATDSFKMTSLHQAVISDNVSLINLLVEQGASIYARVEKNETPLDIALQRDSHTLVTYFKKLHRLKIYEIWVKILKQKVTLYMLKCT